MLIFLPHLTIIVSHLHLHHYSTALSITLLNKPSNHCQYQRVARMPNHAQQQQLQLNAQNRLNNLNANLEAQTHLQSQIPSNNNPTPPKAGTTPQAIMKPTITNATSTNTTSPAIPAHTRQAPNISLISSTCFVLVGGALVCMAVLGFYSTGTLGIWYRGFKNFFGRKKTWLQRSACTPRKEKVTPGPRGHRYSDGVCKRAHAHGDGGFKGTETRAPRAWGCDGAGDEMGKYGGRIGLLERWRGDSGSPRKKGAGEEEDVEMGDWDAEGQLRELETARIVCDRLSFSVV
ncbi:hypothetical protein BDV97DRAFT_190294 [Delphinella strobiligena]|nr:hypothetical protein BDV97DRAFT_190294 [Delphinella strobiligena]